MIGIEGGYVFDASIEGTSIVVDMPFLRNFVLRQQAENNLPQFKLEFFLPNEDYLSLLNEGNTIRFSLGRYDQVNNVDMYITDTLISPSGDDQYNIKLEGLLDASDYVSFRRCRTSDGPERSIEVIENVVKQYFYYESNTQGVSNRQIWIQPSVSDRNFVTHLWKGTYMPYSWPAVAVSAFGPTFRLIDVFRLLRKDPVDWELGVDVSNMDDRRIPILAGFNTKSASGIWNQFYGYPTKLRSESLDDGVSEYINQEVRPLWSGNKLNRRRKVGSRVGKLVFKNENHHDKFHHAGLNNPAWGALMSTLRVEVIAEYFHDYRPLDSAKLMVAGLDNNNSANLSGNYLIDTVIHRIRGSKYSASLILARESLGDMRGTFDAGDIDVF